MKHSPAAPLASPRNRPWPAPARIAFKLLLFALVLLAVCFPDPRLLVRHVRHVRNMDAMIDPAAPELAAFERDFREFRRAQRRTRPGYASVVSAWTAASAPASRAALLLKDAEAFILDRVAYDWDWNTWGAADYMPTVSEMFRRARDDPGGKLREDCDGRAVLAASLMRRLGHDAHLVTDFAHVWVRVAQPRARPIELMSPGRAAAVESTERGNRLRVDAAILRSLPLTLAYGISVFPWPRELVVYLALLILLSHRRMGWRRFAVGAALLLAGWLLLRAPADYWKQQADFAWFGIAYVAAGAIVLMRASASARAKPTPHPAPRPGDPNSE